MSELQISNINKIKVLCENCNKERYIFKSNAKLKKTNLCKSCSTKLRNYKHGSAIRGNLTRIYTCWKNINSRCYNKNKPQFKDWGGRGITVCDEWRQDFNNFKKWAMSNGYSDDLSIDRIDNDGNYEPSNCRWATRQQQSYNTRILSIKNKSGYRGVNYRVQNKKYVAQISINGNKKNIGTFKNAIDAAIAYDKFIADNNMDRVNNGLLNE